MALRALLQARGGQLARTGRQPNGEPLVELWSYDVH